MVDDYVEVVVVDLEKDWKKLENNLYCSAYDSQHYLKKVDGKFFLESWYVYHHTYHLKTVKEPLENTNY